MSVGTSIPQEKDFFERDTHKSSSLLSLFISKKDNTSIYNKEKYLPETLDSILRQTYEEYELIVVNDGSTDSTSEILAQYQKRFSTAGSGLIVVLIVRGGILSIGILISKMNEVDIIENKRVFCIIQM